MDCSDKNSLLFKQKLEALDARAGEFRTNIESISSSIDELNASLKRIHSVNASLLETLKDIRTELFWGLPIIGGLVFLLFLRTMGR
jgi:hypothetical protein